MYPVPPIRRHPGIPMLMIICCMVLTGALAPAAWAAKVSATWTGQADFESNAATTGEATTRTNIDTTSAPGDVKIGSGKEFVTTATLTNTTANNKVYATGVGRASIAVLDASGNTLQKTIPLPGQPAGVVYNAANNKLYVGKFNDNKVTVIDCASDTVIATLTLGTKAYAAIYNTVSNKVYIANTGDQTVSVLDGATDSVLAIVPVTAGATTASYDAVANKVYLTGKDNNYVVVIDGATDQVQKSVEIEAVASLLGGQAPGNVGLRVNAPAMGVTTWDTVRLSWNYDTLALGQKIQFQIRTAPDAASLDGTVYHGPDGTADTWYDLSTDGVTTITESDGTQTAGLNLNLPYTPLAELQLKLASDGITTPTLHSVTLDFVSYPDLTATSVSGPATAMAGTSVAVSSTVANLGTEAAGSFKVGLYLYNAATGSATFLGDRTVASLAPGANDTAGVTATIPTMPVGTYYYQACADYTNQVVEGNETNNCALGSAVNVTLPDLTTTGASGPAAATIGNSVTLSSTIKNQGGVAAGSFKVGLYLNNAATGVDTFLGERTIASLVAGATDTATTAVTIPTMPTGDYHVKACADYTNLVTETDESNNCMVGSAISISSVLPDLVVKSVSGTVANGVLTYSVTVKNQGTTTTSGFYTGIYLSSDAAIITGYKVALTSTALAGGQSATLTGTASVPANLTGTYYVGAMADSQYSVAESDETNNVLAGNQVSIYNDLVVTAVSGSVVGNGTISYSVTVKNLGNGVTGGFYTGIYLSSDATITTSDKVVAAPSTSLAGGQSTTLTGTASVPANLTGTYYVGAIADYINNAVPESDETNNTLAGNQVSIYNDLVVTAVSGSVVGNGTISYSVTVKNLGNGVTGGFYTGIYLSSDATITTSDKVVAAPSTSLAGGQSTTLTGTASVPANLTGTYYVGAIADYINNAVPESDETNNTLAGNQVSIYNDLVVTAVSGSVVGNGTISYSVTVKNLGNGVTSGFYTGIYLSDDATITTSDKVVAAPSTSLAGGQSTTLTGTASVPANLTGTYYVGAIADYINNAVPESDETNNTLAGNQVSIYNDLVVTAVSGSVNGNGTISYSVTVKNLGNGVTGGFYTGIYLSSDAAITTGDTIVAAPSTSLAGGQSATLTGTASVPTSLPAGTYYVGAIADYINNAVPESDETNNALAGNQVTK